MSAAEAGHAAVTLKRYVNKERLMELEFPGQGNGREGEDDKGGMFGRGRGGALGLGRGAVPKDAAVVKSDSQ